VDVTVDDAAKVVVLDHKTGRIGIIDDDSGAIVEVARVDEADRPFISPYFAVDDRRRCLVALVPRVQESSGTQFALIHEMSGNIYRPSSIDRMERPARFVYSPKKDRFVAREQGDVIDFVNFQSSPVYYNRGADGQMLESITAVGVGVDGCLVVFGSECDGVGAGSAKPTVSLWGVDGVPILCAETVVPQPTKIGRSLAIGRGWMCWIDELGRLWISDIMMRRPIELTTLGLVGNTSDVFAASDGKQLIVVDKQGRTVSRYTVTGG